MLIEKWDVLDQDGNKTGKTTQRGKNALKAGEYHLVVHIWVISKDDKILIQKRSATKELMPNEWAATGGAAIAGEDSFLAARRELFEELGIKTNTSSLKKLIRLKRKNSFLDVWVTFSDREQTVLRLQKSEVASAKWVSREELLKMIEMGEYHNYGKYYFDTVLEKIDELRGMKV